MGEVLRAMTDFSWAMTVFGARQLGNLVLVDSDRAKVSFDAVADAAGAGLGGGLDSLLQAGERLQSETVNRLFGMVGPDPVTLSLAVLAPSAEAMKVLPGQRLVAQELANKIQAFGDFQYAESRLGCAGDDPLAIRLERAAALDPYHRLWAVEGLGFARAERTLRAPAAPDAYRGDTPSEAAIPLHTGMGVSLAMRSLSTIDTRGGDGSLWQALERFIGRCQASSLPGYAPMAFEALGLVVRNLHPHLLRRVDRLLAAIDQGLVETYWHGVGRALYFLPSHVLPRSDAWRRALEKTQREAPHDAGRRNALAGFAWALALVNIRHPEVVESFLASHLDEISDRRAFADGIRSALVVWYGSNRREAILEGFLGHRPRRSVAADWQQWGR